MHGISFSIPFPLVPDDEHVEATLERWTFGGQTRLNERRTLPVLNLSDSLGTLIVVSCYSDD